MAVTITGGVRGGKLSELLSRAPKGCMIYVAVEHVELVQNLAQKLGREDLVATASPRPLMGWSV